jgi:hypothetical protein
MRFEARMYGEEVAKILALDGDGTRLMPLAKGTCSSPQARERIAGSGAPALFPGARAPEAALAALYLYFSCWEEAHETAQSVHTAEGSYWHAIVHRQEPDAGNSSYWFRRAGRHAIFPALLAEAAAIAGPRFGQSWDPFGFIEECEQARREPGSEKERMVLEIQRAEWQLLFDYCAAPA